MFKWLEAIKRLYSSPPPQDYVIADKKAYDLLQKITKEDDDKLRAAVEKRLGTKIADSTWNDPKVRERWWNNMQGKM